MRHRHDEALAAAQTRGEGPVSGLLDEERPAHEREQLARAIRQVSVQHGLDPRDYHAQALAVPPPSADARALAEHELLLTDAMMRLAYHLHFGKVDARARHVFEGADRGLVRLAEAAGEKSKDKLAQDIFSEKFLVKRPLARALEGKKGAAPVETRTVALSGGNVTFTPDANLASGSASITRPISEVRRQARASS